MTIIQFFKGESKERKKKKKNAITKIYILLFGYKY